MPDTTDTDSTTAVTHVPGMMHTIHVCIKPARVLALNSNDEGTKGLKCSRDKSEGTYIPPYVVGRGEKSLLIILVVVTLDLRLPRRDRGERRISKKCEDVMSKKRNYPSELRLLFCNGSQQMKMIECLRSLCGTRYTFPRWETCAPLHQKPAALL